MSEENVSLPVAQALASALEKIEAYVPTEYVDNSEPDIDAEHLNHAEQGIMRVTNLLNAAVDVIQGQEIRLADAETKIGTAALTGGMTDLSSGVNSLYSNLISSEMQTTQEATITSATLSRRGKTAMISCVFTTLKDMSTNNYDTVAVGYLPAELRPVKEIDVVFGRQGSNDSYYGRIRASGRIELWRWGGKEVPNGTIFSFSSVFLTA